MIELIFFIVSCVRLSICAEKSVDNKILITAEHCLHSARTVHLKIGCYLLQTKQQWVHHNRWKCSGVICISQFIIKQLSFKTAKIFAAQRMQRRICSSSADEDNPTILLHSLVNSIFPMKNTKSLVCPIPLPPCNYKFLVEPLKICLSGFSNVPSINQHPKVFAIVSIINFCSGLLCLWLWCINFPVS